MMCPLGLILLILSLGLALVGAAVISDGYSQDSARFALENQLSLERTENAAIARLYENVLDVLQCRLPRQEGMLPEQPQQPQQRTYLAKLPVQDQNWRSPKGLGQVSGVSVDHLGRPVIFHRADRQWEYDSFDSSHQYARAQDGPIAANTVLTLNPDSAEVEDEWGSNTFYLPHGIHIDTHGNYWLTDVALHQVFKFPRRGAGSAEQAQPSLVLGERLVPGSDGMHFCQPTAVAVMPSGEVAVADGYCNERVLIFDASGRPIGQLPPYGNEDTLRLRVPHSLALLRRGEVCVADREHQRVVCFDLAGALRRRERLLAEGRPERQLEWPPLRVHRPGVCRIFGLAAHGDMLYAVNGPTTPSNPLMGFTLEPDRGSVLATWAPSSDAFNNPHEIAVCPNGSALYVTEIGPNVVWKFRLLTDWKM